MANPVTLEGHVLSGVVAIAASPDNSVALKSDGSVVVWGNNEFNQATVPGGCRQEKKFSDSPPT
jgi:alpha-tubulin suppressor-like RCC1 family protein